MTTITLREGYMSSLETGVHEEVGLNRYDGDCLTMYCNSPHACIIVQCTLILDLDNRSTIIFKTSLALFQ